MKKKGKTLLKIPFYGDDRSEAKVRRRKWTDFVKFKVPQVDTKRFICSVFLSLRSRGRPAADIVSKS